MQRKSLNDNWIPCNKALPEEPKERLDELHEIEWAIKTGKVKEYIVTIEGATEPTSLYYIGDGFWHDETNPDDIPPVIAWQPYPTIYQPDAESNTTSDDLISRSALTEEIKSLEVKITGLRAGKGVLREYIKQYRESVLRIIDEQPTAYDVDAVVEQLMILHDKGPCPNVDILECVLDKTCSDCYREKVTDIVCNMSRFEKVE